ncbi:hypothetical protein QAD02_000424 [Eretmocerus hayati]|uniref:Uncharacterized protein n=1 Tax=Eretmocerus hayati TaxID=131215 RepID=A0ACC2NHX4_9HYME|nr:hypothetical protein QAD02_000424 [Eretmocerus hayati]
MLGGFNKISLGLAREPLEAKVLTVATVIVYIFALSQGEPQIPKNTLDRQGAIVDREIATIGGAPRSVDGFQPEPMIVASSSDEDYDEDGVEFDLDVSSSSEDESDVSSSSLDDEYSSDETPPDESDSEVEEREDITESLESLPALVSSTLSYNNSKVTLEQAMFMLADIFVECKLPKDTLDRIVKMFNYVLPEGHSFPNSGYLFLLDLKGYEPDNEPIRHHYCKECYFDFKSVKPHDAECSCCQSTRGYGVFYEFDIKKQIKFLFEHRNLGNLL